MKKSNINYSHFEFKLLKWHQLPVNTHTYTHTHTHTCQPQVKNLGTFTAKFLVINAETVIRRCSVKKVFLKISQISQENHCGRLSFLIKLKKRLWHRCFSVNFAKFLRTPFFREHLRWLLL